MRVFQSSTTSVGLLVLVLIFILLIALIVVFSQQILINLAGVDVQANILAYVVAIAFPLILLGLIVFQIVRLIRERTSHKPGSRLKTRLLMFFVLIALLSSIPQALLSVNFVNSAINFWLEARLGEALRGGLSISLEYYRDTVENLRGFNRSPLLSSILEDLNRNPERLWRNVRTVNSEVQFIQVFAADGSEVLFRGEPQGRLRSLGIFNEQTGDLPKEDREDASILRNASVFELNGREYAVVVGRLMPEDFDDKARRLTESLEIFNQLNRYKRLFRLVLIFFYFFFSFPIFLLSILVSFLLTEEIIRPIVNLEEATRRVAEGDFSFRILSRSADELSHLVGSFNRMVSELSHSREKLRQSEKISAWQEIAQRLAHEIKNPLTPIKLSAQRILRKYSADPEAGAGEFQNVLKASVSSIVREVDNLNELLVEFREFARLPMPRLQSIPLGELVEEVVAMYRNLSASVAIDCSHVSEDSVVRADPGQIKQVIANLIRNAIQAMPRGGEVSIRSAVVNKENRRFCRIWIKDSGEGIPEEIRNRVFEPYFTSKREGAGLGLAIVERIVFDHDGSIWFETQEGVGTTFIIDLPLG
ncbi:MAG: HAMP domain-containing protein [Spirochaetaceae bacterium]|nr:MAG: HAMP domain-containing protein [Spirochaetaceae bacterium]